MTGSPRRLLVAHDSNVYGGMEVHVELMLRFLDRTRYEPMVLVPHPSEGPSASPALFIERVRELDVPVIRPADPGDHPGRRTLNQVLGVARLAREHRVDVVHIHTNVPTRPRSVVLGARLARVPVVVRSEHLPPSHFGVRRSTVPLARGIDVLTDAVVVGSTSCYDEQVDVLGRSDRLLRLLFYGIDVAAFEPDHDVAAAKRAVGLPDDEPVVGAVGRLHEMKGHRHLIAAVPKMLERHGPVRVLIVGDGPLRGELQDVATELGVGDRIVFAGYQSTTQPWIAAMDVATMPTSIDEGISLAMLEFMAMRKPVVATDDPSFAETVIDGASGLIVPKADPDALADAVIGLLRRPERASRMADAGRQLVLDRFSAGRQAADLMTLYDELLDARRRRRP